MSSSSSSASHHPGAADPTRAGSLAGEGRLRPGRPDGPAAEVEGGDAPVPTRAPGAGRSEEPETADLPVVTPTAPDASGDSGHDRTPARHAAPRARPPRSRYSSSSRWAAAWSSSAWAWRSWA
ncbi:hypothetical protein ACQ4WX_25575 [Streptomyces lasalocidi]